MSNSRGDTKAINVKEIPRCYSMTTQVLVYIYIYMPRHLLVLSTKHYAFAWLISPSCSLLVSKNHI